MATKIQLRHDTSSNWATVNPILAVGEVGIEVDTNKAKFGNGTTAYNDLPYIAETVIKSYTDLTNKPQINSVELVGNITLDELNIQIKGDYATTKELNDGLNLK